jgi:hypothetical protein
MNWSYDGQSGTSINGSSAQQTSYPVGGARSDYTAGSGKSTYGVKYEYFYESFLQFNLPSFLPYTEQVTSASLSMYVTTSYNSNGSGTISAKKYNWTSSSVGSSSFISGGQVAPNAVNFAAWQTSSSPTYATLNYPSSVAVGRYNFVTSGSLLVSDINARNTIKIALINNSNISAFYDISNGSSNQIIFAEDAIRPSLKPQLILTTTVSSGFKNFKVASNFPYITSSYVDILSYAAINGNLDTTGNINSLGLISSPSIQTNTFNQTSGNSTLNNALFSGSHTQFYSTSTTFYGITRINATSLAIENLTISSNSTGISISGNSTNSITVTGGVGNSITKIGGGQGTGTGAYTIAIGYQAGGNTGAAGNISMGQQAGRLVTGINNIAIGYQSQISASSDYGIGIGFQAAAGTNSISIGRVSGTNGYSNSIALGYNAQAYGSGAIAIGTDSGGNGAAANNINEIALGTSLHKTIISGSLSVSNIINTGSLTMPVTTGRIPSVIGYSASATNSTSVTASGTTPAGFGTFTLTSGRLYEYKIVMFYQVSATTVAFKSYLTYPTLTRGSIQAITSTNTTAFSQVGTSNALTSTSTTITPTNAGAASTLLTATLQGILLPSASGIFSYQFGPATTGTASAMVGSYITVTEIG